jgi:cytochrome c
VRFVAAVALLLPAAVAAQTPPPRGAVLFLQCRSCHSIKPGEPHKIGPNLGGVAGSAAASKPGYTYSPALTAAKIRWTDERLDAFLTSPAAIVPGTKMAFAGLKRAEDRAAVIRFLKEGPR